MTPKDSAAMSSLTEKLRAANEAAALRLDGEEKVVVETHGPWRIQYHTTPKGDPVPFITSDDGAFTIASIIPHDGFKARACLIAAAPDLLDVTRKIAAIYEDTDAPLGIAARAAIAKADGL